MKNLFYYLMLVFGILMLSSCDPSQDANGDFLVGVDYDPTTDTGGTDPPAGRVLTQLISHIKDEDTGEYEDANYIYTYTGNKLTSYKDDAGEVTKFEYNSSNKISKMSATGQTSIFEYSGANLSKVTSTIEGAAKITATYSFSGGKLSKIVSIQDYSIPFPIKAYYETTFQFQGENMMKSVIKNGIYNPVTGDLEMSPEEQSVSFTYDTKKSPYKLLPAEYNLCLIGIAPQGGNFLSANNSEKVTVANSGVSAQIMTYSHVYDSENYPTKSTSGQDFIEYKYK